MAKKRMFNNTVLDTDAFLDMPLSAQALYFHLNLRADDDGFISNPKRVQAYIGASEDDLKLLVLKRFILTFDDGVIVIKHWRLHNTIQKDRYVPTHYQDDLKMLGMKENKAYTLNVSKMETKCIQNVSTDIDIGLDIGLDIDLDIDKDINNTLSKDNVRSTDVQRITDEWNKLSDLGIKPISKLTSGTKRYDSLMARIKQYGIDDVINALGSIRNSKFLQGHNRNGWMITFDWFVKTNNFIKVLEGNYLDAENNSVQKSNAPVQTNRFDCLTDEYKQELVRKGAISIEDETVYFSELSEDDMKKLTELKII